MSGWALAAGLWMAFAFGYVWGRTGPDREDWAKPATCPSCGDAYNMIHRGACPNCAARLTAAKMGLGE